MERSAAKLIVRLLAKAALGSYSNIFLKGPPRVGVGLQLSLRPVIAIYASTIYTARYVMFFMRAARSIMRASGRGLGPGNQDFFGP